MRHGAIRAISVRASRNCSAPPTARGTGAVPKAPQCVDPLPDHLAVFELQNRHNTMRILPSEAKRELSDLRVIRTQRAMEIEGGAAGVGPARRDDVGLAADAFSALHIFEHGILGIDLARPVHVLADRGQMGRTAPARSSTKTLPSPTLFRRDQARTNPTWPPNEGTPPPGHSLSACRSKTNTHDGSTRSLAPTTAATGRPPCASRPNGPRSTMCPPKSGSLANEQQLGRRLASAHRGFDLPRLAALPAHEAGLLARYASAIRSSARTTTAMP